MEKGGGEVKVAPWSRNQMERAGPKERGEKEIGGWERDWGRLEKKCWAGPYKKRNEGREKGIEKRKRTGLANGPVGKKKLEVWALTYWAELAERKNR